jgi:hypothetical protein
MLYEFTLSVAGGALTHALADELYRAGCDDMTFEGAYDAGPAPIMAHVDREAPSFMDAVMSAISDIESVAPLRVEAIEVDDLVTLGEIAKRLGRTRESVRLLMTGRRGPGGFPPPVARIGRHGTVWSWPDVAAWANRALGTNMDPGVAVEAPVVNAALRLRRASKSEREALRPLLAS